MKDAFTKYSVYLTIAFLHTASLFQFLVDIDLTAIVITLWLFAVLGLTYCCVDRFYYRSCPVGWHASPFSNAFYDRGGLY